MSTASVNECRHPRAFSKKEGEVTGQHFKAKEWLFVGVSCSTLAQVIILRPASEAGLIRISAQPRDL